MPASPTMPQAVLAMEEELMRNDEGASYHKAAKGIEQSVSIRHVTEEAADVEKEESEEESEEGLDETLAELEAVLSQTKELENELQEAGSWAEEMTGIWAKTEAHWQEKMQELHQRAEAAGDKAQVGKGGNSDDVASAMEEASSPGRIEEIEALIKEAEKKAKSAEAKAKQESKLVFELVVEAQEAELLAKEMEAKVEAKEAKLSELEAAVKEVARGVETSEEDVQMAATWADETTAKYEAEIADRMNELNSLTQEVVAFKKANAGCEAASVEAPAGSPPETAKQDAEAATLLGKELTEKLETLESVLASERNKSQEVVASTKELKQSNALSISKEAEAVKEEAERCAELQKELESVNREIKSSKANVKTLADKKEAAPKRIEELRKEEAASCEGQRTAEHALETALSQLQSLKAKIDAVPEEERLQRMQQMLQAKQEAKLREAKEREEARLAKLEEARVKAEAVAKVEKLKELHEEKTPSSTVSVTKAEAATTSGAKSIAKVSEPKTGKEAPHKVAPVAPRTKAAKVAAREASRDLASGRSSHKGNRDSLASKQAIIWAVGFVVAVQVALAIGKHFM